MNQNTHLSARDEGTARAEIQPRLMSLDALRGFNMFWIIGRRCLVRGPAKVSDNGVLGEIHTQLEHVEWEGFHFEDLIFPMFVFIVGVSLVFSLSRTLDRAGRRQRDRAVIRRAVLLYRAGRFLLRRFRRLVTSRSVCWVCCSGSRSATCVRD